MSHKEFVKFVLNLLIFFSGFCFTQGMYVHINHIMSVAKRLIGSQHYASEMIEKLANNLDHHWRAFAVALDERSTLLAMSVMFNRKAEEVIFRYLNINLMAMS